MSLSFKTTFNSGSAISGWGYLGMLTLISCQQHCFRFEPLSILLGLGSSLLFLLASLGFAIAGKRQTQRHQPLELFFVGMLAFPLAFWLFFYLRDAVFA